MNKRLKRIRIKAIFYTISLIFVHYATENSGDAFDGAFYASLKKIYNKCMLFRYF